MFDEGISERIAESPPMECPSCGSVIDAFKVRRCVVCGAQCCKLCRGYDENSRVACMAHVQKWNSGFNGVS